MNKMENSSSELRAVRTGLRRQGGSRKLQRTPDAVFKYLTHEYLSRAYNTILY